MSERQIDVAAREKETERKRGTFSDCVCVSMMCVLQKESLMCERMKKS